MNQKQSHPLLHDVNYMDRRGSVAIAESEIKNYGKYLPLNTWYLEHVQYDPDVFELAQKTDYSDSIENSRVVILASPSLQLQGVEVLEMPKEENLKQFSYDLVQGIRHRLIDHEMTLNLINNLIQSKGLFNEDNLVDFVNWYAGNLSKNTDGGWQYANGEKPLASKIVKDFILSLHPLPTHVIVEDGKQRFEY